jgi:hypothetical protein
LPPAGQRYCRSGRSSFYLEGLDSYRAFVGGGERALTLADLPRPAAGSDDRYRRGGKGRRWIPRRQVSGAWASFDFSQKTLPSPWITALLTPAVRRNGQLKQYLDVDEPGVMPKLEQALADAALPSDPTVG